MKSEILELAAKLGAKLGREKKTSPGTFEITADAPARFVWTAEGDVHELVSQGDTISAARADLLARMKDGITPCPARVCNGGDGCDWCGD